MSHFAWGLINSVSGFAITAAARLDGVTANMTRTFGTPSSSDFAMSLWMLKNENGRNQDFISAGNQNVYISGSDQTAFYNGSTVGLSTAVLRDTTSWSHIFIRRTGTTVEIFHNGVLTSTYTGSFTAINTAILHYLFKYMAGAEWLNAYVAELHFCDVSGLAWTDFAEFNAPTNRPDPIKYTGTYGNNGFYLGEDIATGVDSSGNGNNWTVNGTITAVTNTPTDVKATWNRLDAPSQYTLSEGNTRMATSSAGIYCGMVGFVFDSNLDVYFEVPLNSLTTDASGFCFLGFVPKSYDRALNINSSTTRYVINDDGSKYTNAASSVSDQANWGATDHFMFFWKGSTGDVWVGVNGTWYGSGDPDTDTNPYWTGVTGEYVFGNFIASGSGRTFNANIIADEAGWAYTSPVGASDLSYANLPEFTGGDLSTAFLSGTYVGNITARTISFTDDQGNPVTLPTGTQGKLHIKADAGSYSHYIFDTVRGPLKNIRTDTTAAEVSTAGTVTAMNLDGFDLGTATDTNNTGVTYYWWFEVAGVGTEVDTSGTITSTVSAGKNMSIVTYTGTGVAGTIGHRGTQDARVPKMIVVYNLDSANQHPVYHVALGATKRIFEESTAAADTSINGWNNTEPTDSVFSVYTSSQNNASGQRFLAIIRYDEPDTHCVVRSFQGNTVVDGPYFDTSGPLTHSTIKSSGSGTNWTVHSKDQDTNGNVMDQIFELNNANAIQTQQELDYLAAGVKIRKAGGSINTNDIILVQGYIKYRVGPTTMPRGQ